MLWAICTYISIHTMHYCSIAVTSLSGISCLQHSHLLQYFLLTLFSNFGALHYLSGHLYWHYLCQPCHECYFPITTRSSLMRTEITSVRRSEKCGYLQIMHTLPQWSIRNDKSTFFHGKLIWRDHNSLIPDSNPELWLGDQ